MFLGPVLLVEPGKTHIIYLRDVFIRDAPIRNFGADHRSPKAVSADPDIADHRSQRQIHKFFNIVVSCNFHIFKQ